MDCCWKLTLTVATGVTVVVVVAVDAAVVRVGSGVSFEQLT